MSAAATTMDGCGAQDAPLSPRAPHGGDSSTAAQQHSSTEPWFTAAQVAQRVGREKRAVLLWMEEGMAHRVQPRGRLKVKVAQLSVVRAYMESRGLAEGSSGGADGSSGSAGSAVSAPEDVSPEVNPLFEARVLEELGRELELHVGRIDFATTMARARKAFDSMMGKAPSPLSAAADKDKWASAVERCSRVLERLDKAAFESESRTGKWMERIAARGMLVSQAGMFASDLTSLEVDLPRGVIAALAAGGYIDPSKAEEAGRVAAVAARELVGKSRARRAEEIRRAVGVLEISHLKAQSSNGEEAP